MDIVLEGFPPEKTPDSCSDGYSCIRQVLGNCRTIECPWKPNLYAPQLSHFLHHDTTQTLLQHPTRQSLSPIRLPLVHHGIFRPFQLIIVDFWRNNLLFILFVVILFHIRQDVPPTSKIPGKSDSKGNFVDDVCDACYGYFYRALVLDGSEGV